MIPIPHISKTRFLIFFFDYLQAFHEFLFSSKLSQKCSAPFLEDPCNSNPVCVTAHRQIFVPSHILLPQIFIPTLASLLANSLHFAAILSPETAFLYPRSVSESFHLTYSADKLFFTNHPYMDLHPYSLFTGFQIYFILQK